MRKDIECLDNMNLIKSQDSIWDGQRDNKKNTNKRKTGGRTCMTSNRLSQEKIIIDIITIIIKNIMICFYQVHHHLVHVDSTMQNCHSNSHTKAGGARNLGLKSRQKSSDIIGNNCNDSRRKTLATENDTKYALLSNQLRATALTATKT